MGIIDAKVLTPEGECPIEDISLGQRVLTFDTSRRLGESEVTHIFTSDVDSYYEVTLENGLKINSFNKTFYTPTGFLNLVYLAPKDYVYVLEENQMKPRRIKEIKKITSNTTVRDIEVADTHTYFANGFAVHNTSYVSPKVAAYYGVKVGQVVDTSVKNASFSGGGGGGGAGGSSGGGITPAPTILNGITYTTDSSGNVVGKNAGGNVVYNTTGMASQTAKKAIANAIASGSAPGSTDFSSTVAKATISVASTVSSTPTAALTLAAATNSGGKTTWIPRSDLAGGGFYRVFAAPGQTLINSDNQTVAYLDYGAGANKVLTAIPQTPLQVAAGTPPTLVSQLTTTTVPVWTMDAATGKSLSALPVNVSANILTAAAQQQGLLSSNINAYDTVDQAALKAQGNIVRISDTVSAKVTADQLQKAVTPATTPSISNLRIFNIPTAPAPTEAAPDTSAYSIDTSTGNIKASPSAPTLFGSALNFSIFDKSTQQQLAKAQKDTVSQIQAATPLPVIPSQPSESTTTITTAAFPKSTASTGLFQTFGVTGAPTFGSIFTDTTTPRLSQSQKTTTAANLNILPSRNILDTAPLISTGAKIFGSLASGFGNLLNFGNVNAEAITPLITPTIETPLLSSKGSAPTNYYVAPAIKYSTSNKSISINPNPTNQNVSMHPFITQNNVTIQRVPPSDIKVGDVVSWQPTVAQTQSLEGRGTPEFNAQLARNLQLGVSTPITNSYLSAYGGGMLHQVIWTDGVHFITPGTNQATNSAPDPIFLSFSDNYIGKAVLNNSTQAALDNFYNSSRAGKSNIGEVYSSVYNQSTQPTRTPVSTTTTIKTAPAPAESNLLTSAGNRPLSTLTSAMVSPSIVKSFVTDISKILNFGNANAATTPIISSTTTTPLLSSKGNLPTNYYVAPTVKYSTEISPISINPTPTLGATTVRAGSPLQQVLFNMGMPWGAGENLAGTGLGALSAGIGSVSINPNPTLGATPKNASTMQSVESSPLITPTSGTLAEAASRTNAAAKTNIYSKLAPSEVSSLDVNLPGYTSKVPSQPLLSSVTSASAAAKANISPRLTSIAGLTTSYPGQPTHPYDQYTLPTLTTAQLSSLPTSRLVQYYSDRGYKTTVTSHPDLATGQTLDVVTPVGVSNQQKFLANNPDASRQYDSLKAIGGTGISIQATPMSTPAGDTFTYKLVAANAKTDAELKDLYEKNIGYIATGQYGLRGAKEESLAQQAADVLTASLPSWTAPIASGAVTLASLVAGPAGPIAVNLLTSREVSAGSTAPSLISSGGITIPSGQYYTGPAAINEQGQPLSYSLYSKITNPDVKPLWVLPSANQLTAQAVGDEAAGKPIQAFGKSALAEVTSLAEDFAGAFPTYYNSATSQLQAGRAYNTGNVALGNRLVSQLPTDTFLGVRTYGAAPVINTATTIGGFKAVGAFAPALLGSAGNLISKVPVPGASILGTAVGTAGRISTTLLKNGVALPAAFTGFSTVQELQQGKPLPIAAGTAVGQMAPYLVEPLARSMLTPPSSLGIKSIDFSKPVESNSVMGKLNVVKENILGYRPISTEYVGTKTSKLLTETGTEISVREEPKLVEAALGTQEGAYRTLANIRAEGRVSALPKAGVTAPSGGLPIISTDVYKTSLNLPFVKPVELAKFSKLNWVVNPTNIVSTGEAEILTLPKGTVQSAIAVTENEPRQFLPKVVAGRSLLTGELTEAVVSGRETTTKLGAPVAEANEATTLGEKIAIPKVKTEKISTKPQSAKRTTTSVTYLNPTETVREALGISPSVEKASIETLTAREIIPRTYNIAPTQTESAVLSFKAGAKPAPTIDLATGLPEGIYGPKNTMFTSRGVSTMQIEPSAGAIPSRGGIYGVDVKIVDVKDFNTMKDTLGREGGYIGNSAIGRLNSDTGLYEVLIRGDLAGNQRLLTAHEVAEPITRDLLRTNEPLSGTQSQMIAHNLNKYTLETTTKWYDTSLIPSGTEVENTRTVSGTKYALVSPKALPADIRAQYYGSEYARKYSSQLSTINDVIDKAIPTQLKASLTDVGGAFEPTLTQYEQFSESGRPYSTPVTYRFGAKIGESESASLLTPRFKAPNVATITALGLEIRPIGIEAVGGAPPLERIATVPTPKAQYALRTEGLTGYGLEMKPYTDITTPEIMRGIKNINNLPGYQLGKEFAAESKIIYNIKKGSIPLLGGYAVDVEPFKSQSLGNQPFTTTSTGEIKLSEGFNIGGERVVGLTLTPETVMKTHLADIPKVKFETPAITEGKEYVPEDYTIKRRITTLSKGQNTVDISVGHLTDLLNFKNVAGRGVAGFAESVVESGRGITKSEIVVKNPFAHYVPEAAGEVIPSERGTYVESTPPKMGEQTIELEKGQHMRAPKPMKPFGGSLVTTISPEVGTERPSGKQLVKTEVTPIQKINNELGAFAQRFSEQTTQRALAVEKTAEEIARSEATKKIVNEGTETKASLATLPTILRTLAPISSQGAVASFARTGFITRLAPSATEMPSLERFAISSSKVSTLTVPRESTSAAAIRTKAPTAERGATRVQTGIAGLFAPAETTGETITETPTSFVTPFIPARPPTPPTVTTVVRPPLEKFAIKSTGGILGTTEIKVGEIQPATEPRGAVSAETLVGTGQRGITTQPQRVHPLIKINLLQPIQTMTYQIPQQITQMSQTQLEQQVQPEVTVPPELMPSSALKAIPGVPIGFGLPSLLDSPTVGERFAFGGFGGKKPKGRRSILPDLLSVTKSQIAYNRATLGTEEQYAPLMGGLELKVPTAEQMADPYGLHAKRYNLEIKPLGIFTTGIRAPSLGTSRIKPIPTKLPKKAKKQQN